MTEDAQTDPAKPAEFDEAAFREGLTQWERLIFEIGKVAGKASPETQEAVQKGLVDSLTGALNRNGLKEYLESAKTPKAMLWVDATNFKAVNDTYGDERGDQVIQDTFETLRSSLREGDAIARWGGDEFLAILNDDRERDIAPDHPMAYENRQREMSATEHIDEAKQRIAEQVQNLLDKSPDLKAIGFDLAVGGTKWEGQPLNELVKVAALDAKRHKQEQHQKLGQHRKPSHG